jgi:hypothetical protein
MAHTWHWVGLVVLMWWRSLSAGGAVKGPFLALDARKGPFTAFGTAPASTAKLGGAGP